MRIIVRIGAVSLALSLATGVAAGAPERREAADAIYAAFSLIKRGPAVAKRCGSYVVSTGTYLGTSASPDPRLGGNATFVGRIAVNPRTGNGFATGTLRIRDSRRQVRLAGTVRGVISNKTVFNGLVSGTLTRPNALMLANVTIVFNENFTFGAVRLGLEAGQNSAVAYSQVPRC